MEGYIQGIRNEAVRVPAVVCTASLLALTAAFMLQYWGGLEPCSLCYLQRYPYYAVIPLSGLAYLFAYEVPRNSYTNLFMLLCSLAMFTGAGIAAYHVGIEYSWWAGPDACTSSVAGSGSIEKELLAIQQAAIVRCDEVQWSLFGVSMAGYNFITSIFLGTLSWFAALKK
jgi:disulfide bond formation protein DsbB